VESVSFLDCVREYAGYWTTKESGFVSGLAAGAESDRLAALRGAAGYFKIARNFPEEFDTKKGIPRLKPVLDAIDRIPLESVTRESLPQVVDRLRVDFGRSYGSRDLLSAATKLLWLRHRDVVVIFDGNARTALKARYGDYRDYLGKWFSEYRRRAEEIRTACDEFWTELGLEFDPDSRSAGEWFRRRAFDIYLWRTGDPKATNRLR
jgi:hypothetical protein